MAAIRSSVVLPMFRATNMMLSNTSAPRFPSYSSPAPVFTINLVYKVNTPPKKLPPNVSSGDPTGILATASFRAQCGDLTQITFARFKNSKFYKFFIVNIRGFPSIHGDFYFLLPIPFLLSLSIQFYPIYHPTVVMCKVKRGGRKV